MFYNFCFRYLVNEIASSGKGTSTHIPDDDPHINAKVIKALKKAAKPAFTNISIDWKLNAESLKFVVPKSPHIEYLYEEEPFSMYAVLDESKIANSHLEFTFFNTLDQTEETLVLQINLDDIKSSETGYEFQLAARKYIGK